MDAISFQCLDFPLVLERLAGFALSQAARDAIRETQPWTNLETLQTQWDGVMELLDLLDRGEVFPLQGFESPEPLLKKLAPINGILEPEEWLELLFFLELGRQVKEKLEREAETMPRCRIAALPLQPLKDLSQNIRAIIDDEGRVKDRASEELRACRSRQNRLEKNLDRLFNKLLNQLDKNGALQESYWTLRNGRRVLPVRAGAKGRAPGIVQDVSGSGETLFIEPLEAIEPTNALSEEQGREREIIFRILSELSRQCRGQTEAIRANGEALLQLDLWYARARMANRHHLHRPQVEKGAALRLWAAHHPLLYLENPEKSVPLDLELSPENRTLVISGPNTGGKTTSLKTVGLHVLMAQSAIPGPLGRDSRIPLFRQVLVEMGDDQSVAAGLSTFSAHIRRISEILDLCGREALVLLDELGKATDPLQAGALGRAILEALIERDALALVTTHLPTLKDWAEENPAGRNASFRLDPRSHRPRYEMQMDVPGISEAFLIAQAEGLPAEIVERARHALPQEEREMMDLLSALHKREGQLRRETRKARKARENADRSRREMQKKQHDYEKRKTELDLGLEEEYKRLLDQAREDIEKRIARLPSRQAINAARQELRHNQEQAAQRLRHLQDHENRILQKAEAPEQKEPEEAPFVPREGEWAQIGKSGQTGRIIQVNGEKKRAKLQVGVLTVDARFSELRRGLPQEEERAAPGVGFRLVGGGPIQAAPTELDVHGWRVAEAVEELDRVLDRAALAQQSQLRVVHGYGTGALRKGIHDFLRGHPHVARYHHPDSREGGQAVTLIHLK